MSTTEAALEDACVAAEQRWLAAPDAELSLALRALVEASWALAAHHEQRSPVPWHDAGMDGPTPGHAVYALALSASDAARPAMMRSAYHLARRGAAPDGRILRAIAHALSEVERAPVVLDAARAFRAAEASVQLISLVDLTDDPALRQTMLDASVAAAARAPNPQLLGELARGVDPFEPRGVRPLAAEAMETLWLRTQAWPEPARSAVRARIAGAQPPARRSLAVAEVLARLIAVRASAHTGAEDELEVLAPALTSAQLEEAFVVFGARLPLVQRAAELGGIERCVDALSQLREPVTRARAAVGALALCPGEPRLAEAVLSYLRTTQPEPAAWFFQDHAAHLAAGLPHAVLTSIIAALPLEQRVLASGALLPHVAPEHRGELLSATLRDAELLDPPVAHVFVACARELPAQLARTTLMRLLSGHPSRKDLLMGADGEGETYPGLDRLAPLIGALGGDAALEAVVGVIVARTTSTTDARHRPSGGGAR